MPCSLPSPDCLSMSEQSGYGRYKDSVAMVPELLELGAALAQLLEASPQRIAVVISADGAHAHSYQQVIFIDTTPMIA